MGWSTPLPDRATRKVSIASLAIISTGAFARRGTRGVTPLFTDVGRSLWTGLSGGIVAALSALVVFAVVGVGIALSVSPGAGTGLPVAAMTPHRSGNFAELGLPVALGGSTEIGADQSVTLGMDGALSGSVRRVVTTLGDDRALGKGNTTRYFPFGLLVLPGTVALWTLFTLRRATPGGPLWRVPAVLAVLLGSVVTVAGAAQLSTLSLSGLLVDPTSRARRPGIR